MMLPSEKATEIVKNRGGVYGHPYDVYTVWVELCEAIAVEIPIEKAGIVLLLLKVAREHNSGYRVDYPDNTDDMAGYANVHAMIKEAMNGAEPERDAARAPRVGSPELPRRDAKSGGARRRRGSR